MSDYPEHAKLQALCGANQTVGDFIEWLGQQGYTIGHYPILESGEPSVHMQWCGVSRDKLIAQFFDIDTNKLEAEKVAMLEAFRANA